MGQIIYDREASATDDIADDDLGIIYIMIGGAMAVVIAAGIVAVVIGLRAVRERERH